MDGTGQQRIHARAAMVQVSFHGNQLTPHGGLLGLRPDHVLLRCQATRVTGAGDLLQVLHQAQHLLVESQVALQKIQLRVAQFDARGHIGPHRLHLGICTQGSRLGLLALEGPRAKPGQLLGECIARAAHIARPQRGVLRPHFGDVLQFQLKARVRQGVGLLNALLDSERFMAHASQFRIVGPGHGQQRLHISTWHGHFGRALR